MIRAKLTAIVLSAIMAQAATSAPVPEIPEDVPAEPVIEEPAMEYVGDYRVTAFNYAEGDGENYYTASGAEPVPYYTVATNDEFDFGTVLYIENIGVVEVQDRGAFPEGIIDLHIGWNPIESFDDKVRKVYVVRR